MGDQHFQCIICKLRARKLYLMESYIYKNSGRVAVVVSNQLAVYNHQFSLLLLMQIRARMAAPRLLNMIKSNPFFKPLDNYRCLAKQKP